MRALALVLGLTLSACATDPDFQNCTSGGGALGGAGRTLLAGMKAGADSGDELGFAVGLTLGVVLAPAGAIYGAVSCEKSSSRQEKTSSGEIPREVFSNGMTERA